MNQDPSKNHLFARVYQHKMISIEYRYHHITFIIIVIKQVISLKSTWTQNDQ